MAAEDRRDFLSAVLLAAGESTRMGQLKALLPWFGRTLVQFQVDALLQGGADQLIVVTGHRADEVAMVVAERPVVLVHNPDYAGGRTTSIKAGLAHVDPRARAVLVLGVDQPRPARLVARVVRAHFERGALITTPGYQGKGGHPIVFDTRLLPELRAISEERQGLREVLNRHRDAMVRIEVRTPVVLLDLNTPEDYRRAIEAFEEVLLKGRW